MDFDDKNLENSGGSVSGSPNFLVDIFGVLLIRREEFESFEDFSKNPLQINRKLLDFLEKKRDNGSKIAIISNVAQYHFEAEFWSKLSGVEREIFDAVVISGEVGVRKPDVRIFEIAFDWLGVEPRNSVMIDDSPENVEVARSLGARGVVYRNFDIFKKEMEE